MYSSLLDAILDNLLQLVGECGDILLETLSCFPNWELLSMPVSHQTRHTVREEPPEYSPSTLYDDSILKSFRMQIYALRSCAFMYGSFVA